MSLHDMNSQRSRRHFFRVAAAAAAMISLVASQAHATGRRHHGWWWWKPKPPNGGDDHCLLRGTAIHTDRGSVAIESLQVGDRVLTESGAFKPVTGIGRSAFRKDPGGSWDESVMPVRVARSAISDNVPARDLYLTAEHALLIDGNLIPVKHLVNGQSITQIEPAADDVVEYYHLVFEQHEVFYAEGVAVESLQVISRGHYSSFDEYKGEVSEPFVAMAPCAPVLGYFGGRQEAVALLRLAAYPFVDVRDRIQVAYDRIAARAASSDKALAA